LIVGPILTPFTKAYHCLFDPPMTEKVACPAALVAAGP